MQVEQNRELEGDNFVILISVCKCPLSLLLCLSQKTLSLSLSLTLSLSLCHTLSLTLSLSARLEQALRRWTHEKETSSLETEKYIKMRTTSASLVEQLDRALAEVDRLSDRLGQYDNLPMPVSTRGSTNILFCFVIFIFTSIVGLSLSCCLQFLRRH